MSEVLARLRVRETAGIRRFLYPLTAYVDLPEGADITNLGLVDQRLKPVPSQVTSSDRNYRLDFAVSMDPHSEMELTLLSDIEPMTVDDPLQLIMLEDSSLQSTQRQFSVTIAEDGNLSSVIYDNVSHLREPTEVQRLDLTDPRYVRGLMSHRMTRKKLRVIEVNRGGGPLAAWSEIKGDYEDGCKAFIRTEITACKSWAMTRYRLEGHIEPETIFANIPFQSASSRLYFDTGIGDGLYGNVSQTTVGIGWCKTGPPEEVTNGYVMSFRGKRGGNDYIVPLRLEELHSHCWFHLIDDNKAIAVAITKFAPGWHEGLNIRLHVGGYIEIEGLLETESEGPAEFGVCYHFLNDVPAIAAATNPQSILLPPTVEVL